LFWNYFHAFFFFCLQCKGSVSFCFIFLFIFSFAVGVVYKRRMLFSSFLSFLIVFENIFFSEFVVVFEKILHSKQICCFCYLLFLGSAHSQQPLKSLFTSSSANGDRIIVLESQGRFLNRESCLFCLFVCLSLELFPWRSNRRNLLSGQGFKGFSHQVWIRRDHLFPPRGLHDICGMAIIDKFDGLGLELFG